MPGDQNGTSPASLKTTFSPDSIRRALLAAPEVMLRREVVTALRKIDKPRAVDFFPEQLEGLPCAEADRLAHTLAGNDLLNAAWSLARKARASGDLRTLAQAVFAARDAQDEHRLRLDALGDSEGAADVGGGDEGGGADPGWAASKAGQEVIRKVESILRGLGPVR